MNPARRRLIGLAALVCAAAALPSSLRAATVTVTASGTDMDSKFTPAAVTIQVGDTVSWVNAEGVHNVVSDDDLFNSGFVQPPDGEVWPFSYTFNSTGQYRYYCSIHGNKGGVGQSGIVIVRPAHAANEIVLERGAWDFHAVIPGTTTGDGDQELMRCITTGSGGDELRAGLQIPAGSKIVGLEITGCDDDPSTDLTATLLECPDPTGPCVEVVKASSSGQPGCDFFATAVANGPNVNNLSNTYGLSVTLGSDKALCFRNVRVFYMRAIAPAPLTATFGDVPTTHPFFRAIEALAASGITQGCGNGNFCPNDTVTRATMASFFARAFGLFWPN